MATVRGMGVDGTEYLREGMRSMEAIRQAYKGATLAEANAIATGASPSRSTGKALDPVTVVVSKGQAVLRDGRHRLAAAKEAGAREIRTRLITHVRGKAHERTVVLPIHGR